MLHQKDNLVIWVLIILAFLWLIRSIYMRFIVSIPKTVINPNDEITQILDKHGYTTLQRKIKVPIHITKAENEVFEARYFIDAIARKDGFTYAVRVGRTKKPMENTNTSIRDHLFPLFLLANWDGVLYIDKEFQTVTLYMFHFDAYLLPEKRGFLPFVIVFILGVLITLLLT